MSRKMLSSEETYWENPLKSVAPQPYFGDEPWPDDPRDPSWEENIKILKHFYSNKRESYSQDISKLKKYLANPQKYFIIWGEVGIGKSWFISYELLAGDNSMQNGLYHAGIIDMLSELDTTYGIFKQLKHILEIYFERFCEGTTNALIEYFKYDYSNFKLKTVNELTPAELIEIELSVNKAVSLRNSFNKDDLESYVNLLLEVLQFNKDKQLLILAVDNIDKTSDQRNFVKLAVRILRNPQIRLIISLRPQSSMLRDRFSEHQEFSYDDMWLSPLIIPDMLKVRFNWSKKRRKLSNEPKIVDIFDNNEYTFPRLYSHLFTTEDGISEGGRLIVSMAADNAREAIKFTDKLVYSDQLKGLRNISDPEFVVAALMLSDSSHPSLLSSSFILNLFNNDEPDKIGNTLIRFRVLEYFWHNNLIDLAEEKFQNYFQWIGYSIDRVKHVLQIFLMTQVIRSEKGLSSDALQDSDEEQIGNLKITNSGKEYKNLLTKQWYFVAIKRDVYLPESIIFSDEGREYCTHTNFIEWLNQQEENENRAKNNYESANGKFTPDWTLESPAKLAERALKGKKDG